ncbi:DNA invertase Pin-like site-specific DNA recombinase [Rhodobium orientis]|uniref:Recombinase domain-containing protein n=1 Tax=Rhodobium orientis TaxID=34017 RepID=A0A327JLK4_9HYPH|nr:recombinase family protein [Rhodobium orientis]MBB4302831.1 DNA invertase Pin-like site-specific DNA recombinase [Rhodobium orientis]RAI26264.1 hypothetical protein CH339_14865 [Rhodobium orientis]
MKYFIYCRKSQEAEDRQVMSLASQNEEIDRLIEGDGEVTIVDRYEEAFSAKQPGRPLFDEMMRRIERGEAEGIIAWHPDRLARNSMDGGRVIYALDQGTLKNLLFCSYAFENSSQGKFMLNIIFGYSKYYVDSLSENVKRGQRTKIRNGWQPNLAPIGYRNCRETGTIVPDGEHFEIVRRMFGLLLTGNYSVAEIHRVAANEWGYITPTVRTRGGKKLGLSTTHNILNNPFYAGYIRWQGELHPGRHLPVVSKSQFERAQQILGKRTQPRPQRRSFSYGGIFTCGACGLSVTAERKRKPSGREYVYYHCTRVHRTPRCTQPSIEEQELHRQVLAFLDGVRLPEKIGSWFMEAMRTSKDSFADAKAEVAKKLSDRMTSLKKQLSNLTDLRVREVVGDDEFAEKREILTRELAKTEENAENAKHDQITFEPLEILQLLCSKAKCWFEEADNKTKRALLRILCSNPILKDKKVILQARKPFVELGLLTGFSHLRGDVDDVRKDHAACEKRTRLRKRLQTLAADPETVEVAKEARALIEQIDPDALKQLDDYDRSFRAIRQSSS